MIDRHQTLRFYVGLSERKREVVFLVSQGLSNDEVARRLCIQPSVVAEHLTIVYEELTNLLEIDTSRRANRYTLIGVFAPFFANHPDLTPQVEPVLPGPRGN